MENSYSDIMSKIINEINIADAFVTEFGKNDNFDKLNYLRVGNKKDEGLSLTGNKYEELEARCNFAFLVINRGDNPA